MPEKTIKRRLIEAGERDLAGCMTHCGFVLALVRLDSRRPRFGARSGGGFGG